MRYSIGAHTPRRFGVPIVTGPAILYLSCRLSNCLWLQLIGQLTEVELSHFRRKEKGPNTLCRDHIGIIGHPAQCQDLQRLVSKTSKDQEVILNLEFDLGR